MNFLFRFPVKILKTFHTFTCCNQGSSASPKQQCLPWHILLILHRWHDPNRKMYRNSLNIGLLQTDPHPWARVWTAEKARGSRDYSLHFVTPELRKTGHVWNVGQTVSGCFGGNNARRYTQRSQQAFPFTTLILQVQRGNVTTDHNKTNMYVLECLSQLKTLKLTNEPGLNLTQYTSWSD